MPDLSANTWDLEQLILSHFIFENTQGLQDMQQSGDQLQVQQGQQEKVKYKDNTEFKNMSILIKKLIEAIAKEIIEGIKKIDIKTDNGEIIGSIDIQNASITLNNASISMNFASFTSAGTGVFGPSAGPYSFSATASISGTGTLSGMGNISSQNSSINIDNIEVNNPFDW